MLTSIRNVGESSNSDVGMVMAAGKFSHSLSDWILNPMEFIDSFDDLWKR